MANIADTGAVVVVDAVACSVAAAAAILMVLAQWTVIKSACSAAGASAHTYTHTHTMHCQLGAVSFYGHWSFALVGAGQCLTRGKTLSLCLCLSLPVPFGLFPVDVFPIATGAIRRCYLSLSLPVPHNHSASCSMMRSTVRGRHRAPRTNSR